LVVLYDQIKRQLENIRDFFQSCGCSLSPTTFQVGNATLPDVSAVATVARGIFPRPPKIAPHHTDVPTSMFL
jgi:hypothetical protein